MKGKAILRATALFVCAVILVSLMLPAVGYAVELPIIRINNTGKDKADQDVFQFLSSDEISFPPSARDVFKPTLRLFRDAEKTDEITDFSELCEGTEYFYDFECRPGEILVDLTMIAKDAGPGRFVAFFNGEDNIRNMTPTVSYPGDFTASFDELYDTDEGSGGFITKEYEPKVNARDIITLMKYILGARDFKDAAVFVENADFNFDGVLNARDVIAVMKYALGDPTCLSGKLDGGLQSDFKFSFCDSLDSEPTEPDDRTFAQKEYDFAFDLFRDILAAKGSNNAMISPLSFQLCLALAANGAKGDTLAGIEKLAGLTLSEMNGDLAPFAESLKKTANGEEDPDKFNVANSAWFKDNCIIDLDYAARIAEYFNASSKNVPFDSETLDEVNDWVNDETYGMIEKILNEFPDEIVALLIDAVAFEGTWIEPFNSEATRKEDFTGFDGEVFDAQMMRQTQSMSYLENDTFTGFVKQYQSHYAFAALLPKYDGVPTEDALSSAIASLDSESWEELFADKIWTEVSIKMPKFKNEYDLSVVDELLRDKPLPALFDPLRADLSGMITSPDGNVYASDMKQVTFIEVEEKGTRAAAVTFIIEKATAVIDLPLPKEVILDRPFVYAIIDTNTNIPVFIGTLTETQS